AIPAIDLLGHTHRPQYRCTAPDKCWRTYNRRRTVAYRRHEAPGDVVRDIPRDRVFAPRGTGPSTPRQFRADRRLRYWDLGRRTSYARNASRLLPNLATARANTGARGYLDRDF